MFPLLSPSPPVNDGMWGLDKKMATPWPLNANTVAAVIAVTEIFATDPGILYLLCAFIIKLTYASLHVG